MAELPCAAQQRPHKGAFEERAHKTQHHIMKYGRAQYDLPTIWLLAQFERLLRPLRSLFKGLILCLKGLADLSSLRPWRAVRNHYLSFLGP